jgi:hypothetical protein
VEVIRIKVQEKEDSGEIKVREEEDSVRKSKARGKGNL